MIVKCFNQLSTLKLDKIYPAFKAFIEIHPNGNFFQSCYCFDLLENTNENRPVLIIAYNEADEVQGSLLGVLQSNGTGVKSWLSKRLIVWGGPLIHAEGTSSTITTLLLQKLTNYASSRAIFIEFRNLFDTSHLRQHFLDNGFHYYPHLNYLVKTDAETTVKKRMSSNRLRQIKSSLNAGATIEEALTESDVIDFYQILERTYRERVKKPLFKIDFFLNFWKMKSGKFFVIRYNDKVIGGIVCPIFQRKVIYEWYVCGEDGKIKGVHPSVLATWAPIDYAIKNGLEYFDFMGAGKPEDDYGVREFKARFGGDEVNFGRYSLILNRSLYKIGEIGLKIYQKLR